MPTVENILVDHEIKKIRVYGIENGNMIKYMISHCTHNTIRTSVLQ